jgi:ubiquitin-protein ligase
MSGLSEKILMSQMAKYLKDQHTNITLHADPENIHRWYWVFHRFTSDDPEDIKHVFKNGVYVFLTTAPADFPNNPPKLQMVSPEDSGVYQAGDSICISIGQFHKNDTSSKGDMATGWTKGFGMNGFINHVFNGLLLFLPSDHGIRLKVRPPLIKRFFALLSSTEVALTAPLDIIEVILTRDSAAFDSVWKEIKKFVTDLAAEARKDKELYTAVQENCTSAHKIGLLQFTTEFEKILKGSPLGFQANVESYLARMAHNYVPARQQLLDRLDPVKQKKTVAPNESEVKKNIRELLATKQVDDWDRFLASLFI